MQFLEIKQNNDTYNAGSSVLADTRPASDGLGGNFFAVGAGEAGLAGAGVGSLSGVEASPVVLARLVVGAVVEILVAEEPSPTFVAEAVPRLLAGAVETAGIPLALRAEGSLPAAVAPETQRETEVIRCVDHTERRCYQKDG